MAAMILLCYGTRPEWIKIKPLVKAFKGKVRYRIIFTGQHPELFKQLETRGITCVPVQMKATTFWDTGVHCATNEIERAGELID